MERPKGMELDLTWWLKFFKEKPFSSQGNIPYSGALDTNFLDSIFTPTQNMTGQNILNRKILNPK